VCDNGLGKALGEWSELEAMKPDENAPSGWGGGIQRRKRVWGLLRARS
jgi:hypothetical protein